MNLHGIVRGSIGAVNPDVPALLQISDGYDMARGGAQVPKYKTPGRFDGFIDDGVLIVGNTFQGRIAIGQQILSPGVIPGTTVVGVNPNYSHAYFVEPVQTVFADATGGGFQNGGMIPIWNPFFDFSTSQQVLAQVQPLSSKDLRHLDSLNIGGYERAIYLSGRLDGLVRVDKKGGDLVVLPDDTVWLVGPVLEQWPDWVKVAVTMQNAKAGLIDPYAPLNVNTP